MEEQSPLWLECWWDPILSGLLAWSEEENGIPCGLW